MQGPAETRIISLKKQIAVINSKHPNITYYQSFMLYGALNSLSSTKLDRFPLKIKTLFIIEQCAT